MNETSAPVRRPDGSLAGRVRIAGPKILPDQKQCSRCHEVKPKDGFTKASKYADGLDAWCKACRSEYMADYRERTKAEKNRKKQLRAWHRYKGVMLRGRVEALLAAAEKARSLGTWRGREGLRAYSVLGELLAQFQRPLGPTEQDEDSDDGIVFLDADKELACG